MPAKVGSNSRIESLQYPCIRELPGRRLVESTSGWPVYVSKIPKQKNGFNMNMQSGTILCKMAGNDGRANIPHSQRQYHNPLHTSTVERLRRANQHLPSAQVAPRQVRCNNHFQPFQYHYSQARSPMLCVGNKPVPAI
jgi:hypothetical protein